MLLRALLSGCVLPVAKLMFSECFLSAGCTLGLQWIYVQVTAGKQKKKMEVSQLAEMSFHASHDLQLSFIYLQ